MRTIVFGTFDILHPGHKSFLRAAKKLGNHLIVVVARDKFVQKAKGKPPINKERSRAVYLRKLAIADKVVLGSITHDWFRTLRTNKIDLIALGYDQKPSMNQLKKQLRRHRLGKIKVVRLKSLRPEVYKSSKMASSDYS